MRTLYVIIRYFKSTARVFQAYQEEDTRKMADNYLENNLSDCLSNEKLRMINVVNFHTKKSLYITS